MESLRVVELYSGIGGMHYALKESGVPAVVLAAIDVNTTANEIYKHNFPQTTVWPKTIEGITLEDFNRLQFDMILMSPPCQPFTRIGKYGDVLDPRSKSLLYIIDLIPRLNKLPRFILLENVKGFETSSARDALLKVLGDCSYCFQEFLVTPTCLGIPNSRLRYYLVAKAPPDALFFQTSSEIMTSFPPFPVKGVSSEPLVDPNIAFKSNMKVKNDLLFKRETAHDAQRKSDQNSDESVRRIQEFLEEDEEVMEKYLLPSKTLLRYVLLMDIVQPTCRRSVCFTKGYGHYVEGTGSVLQSCSDVDLEEVFKSLEQQPCVENLRQLERLKLRYFTPREVANLMGFPADFSFPENVSLKQRYRVLGNSLNILVVAQLIKLMLL